MLHSLAAISTHRFRFVVVVYHDYDGKVAWQSNNYKMKRLHKAGLILVKALIALAQLPDWLNWILAVVEPLVVLAVTFTIGYTCYWMFFAVDQTRGYVLAENIKELNTGWRAGALLVIVLFYRTARTFLEQAEEAWGVKKKKPLQGQEVAPLVPSDRNE